MSRKFIWIALLVLSASRYATAQSPILSERRFYRNSIDAALGNVNEEQKAIYAGPEYKQYYVSTGNPGNPFFSNTKPESITYNGIRYTGITFIYDTFLDEIIVSNPDNKWIYINKDKVTGFSLGGHQFELMNSRSDIEKGFYEILFRTESISLIARWSKAFKASAWKEEVDFHIIRDKAYAFNTKKELLEILSDKQKEIKTYIRQNHLNFKKDKSASVTKVVQYYSSIR
jgi:hypothetical protein